MLHFHRVLHAGCGDTPLPDDIQADEEVRLDVSPDAKPDVVADMQDLGDIGLFDAVYCSHTLEHLHREAGLRALREFHRVLRPGGRVIVVVPNLQGLLPSEDVLYESPAGPVTSADMFWGRADALDRHPYMAHRYGYVPRTLHSALVHAGFTEVRTREFDGWHLVGAGTRS